MWWSTNSVSTGLRRWRKNWRKSPAAVAVVFLTMPAFAQVEQVHAPDQVTAGRALSIPTNGNGNATYYVVGPGGALKGSVDLGRDIKLQSAETRVAGRYVLTVCSESCSSVEFYVTPSEPANLSLLVHPSRVPVDQSNAISVVAFAFDRFDNLVLAPQDLRVQISVEGAPQTSGELKTRDGVAWLRTNSGKRAGKMQLTASLNGVSAERVIQQVASDPCNLNIQAQQTPKGTYVETAPLRDCSGNPVPDGTIVTFTETGAGGTSTVDAPVKQGIARARVEPGPATVTVASGVVMGKELHLGARP
jgi:hypothetical protein